MRVARLLWRAGAVVGLALPTVVVPASVINATVMNAAAGNAAAARTAVTGEALATSATVTPRSSAPPVSEAAAGWMRVGARAAAPAVENDSVLTLSTTVQGQRIWDASESLPRVPAGEPVNVVYKVRNNTVFDVLDVQVSDPVVGAGAVECPGGGATIADLRALSTVDCFASVPAVAGQHTGFALAGGCQVILLVRYEVADRALIGYVGLAPTLSPTPIPTLTPPSSPAAPPPPQRTPGPVSRHPGRAAVPAAPSPTPGRSTAPPTPSASASPSAAAPLYRAIVAPVAAAPPRHGIPTRLFILIMIMPAAAGAAAAFSRRNK